MLVLSVRHALIWGGPKIVQLVVPVIDLVLCLLEVPEFNESSRCHGVDKTQVFHGEKGWG